MTHLHNIKSHLDHYRPSSKKRCLNQLQVIHPIQVFNSIPPPYPTFCSQITHGKDYQGKIFINKPHCYLEIFTYNYLVLCFESPPSTRSQTLLDYIYELIEKPQFQFIFPSSNSQLNQFTSITLKNIISQYFNYMKQTSDSVFNSLNKYPTLLEIFTAFFRSLLFLGEVCNSYEDDLYMVQTYQFLSSYFDIQITIQQNYAHFPQTDIHIYQQISTQIYMFHPSIPDQLSSFSTNGNNSKHKSGYSSINLTNSNFDQLTTSQILMQIKNNQYTTINQYKQQSTNNTLKKCSRLNKHPTLITSKFKLQSTQKCQIYNTQSSYTNITNQLLKPIQAKPIQTKPKMELMQLKQNVNYQRKNQGIELIQKQDKKKLKKQQPFQKHKKYASELSHLTNNNLLNQSSQQQNFQKNKQSIQTSITAIKSQLQTLHQNVQDYFYRPPTLPTTSYQKPNYIWVNKNITKQFTSSIILDSMPQPYRTSIKNKKQKARDARKNSFNIFS